VVASRKFNQGFSTIEFCASDIKDMAIHLELELQNMNMTAFEAHHLNKMSMPNEITKRHRIPHFSYFLRA
jgi:peptidyl-dipeptidase Dcp